MFSPVLGLAAGSDVRLAAAVRASAAYPPAIPPLALRIRGLKFIRRRVSGDAAKPHGVIHLTDGGVWNNIATDWSQLRQDITATELARLEREQRLTELDALLRAIDRSTSSAVMLVVDAAAPAGPRLLRWLSIPGVSMIGTLWRAFEVTYASTLAARVPEPSTAQLRMLHEPSRWNLEARQPQHDVHDAPGGSSPPLVVGAFLRSEPGAAAKAWGVAGYPPQWMTRADRYAAELDANLVNLERIRTPRPSVPTTFNSLGWPTTLRLVVDGYLAAREALTVTFVNHRPPEFPTAEWFEALVGCGGTVVPENGEHR
jgi:hypothetical protein